MANLKASCKCIICGAETLRNSQIIVTHGGATCTGPKCADSVVPIPLEDLGMIPRSSTRPSLHGYYGRGLDINMLVKMLKLAVRYEEPER